MEVEGVVEQRQIDTLAVLVSITISRGEAAPHDPDLLASGGRPISCAAAWIRRRMCRRRGGGELRLGLHLVERR